MYRGFSVWAFAVSVVGAPVSGAEHNAEPLAGSPTGPVFCAPGFVARRPPPRVIHHQQLRATSSGGLSNCAVGRFLSPFTHHAPSGGRASCADIAETWRRPLRPGSGDVTRRRGDQRPPRRRSFSFLPRTSLRFVSIRTCSTHKSAAIIARERVPGAKVRVPIREAHTRSRAWSSAVLTTRKAATAVEASPAE